MSTSRYVVASGLQATIFEFLLPVSFDRIGIGLIKIPDPENDGFAVGILFL